MTTSDQRTIAAFAARAAQRCGLDAEAVQSVLDMLSDVENEDVVDAVCIELGHKLGDRFIAEMKLNFREKKE
jgi:hypothetical protein